MMSDEDLNISVQARELAGELWRESLGLGHLVGMRVASASMSPILMIGDRIEVAAYPAGRQPRTGDIILIESDNGWLVHRVIGRRPLGGRVYLRQKGDAGHYSTLIPPDIVAGRVVSVERGGRRTRLDTASQRALQYLLGVFLGTMDRLARWTRSESKGKELPVKAPVWRVSGSRFLRRLEAAAVRLGSLLTGAGSR
jgi:hypothetical protein